MPEIKPLKIVDILTSPTDKDGFFILVENHNWYEISRSQWPGILANGQKIDDLDCIQINSELLLITEEQKNKIEKLGES